MLRLWASRGIAPAELQEEISRDKSSGFSACIQDEEG